MRKRQLWSRILVGCYLVPGLVLVIAGNGCASSNCKDAVRAAEAHSLYVESVLSAGARGNELLVRYTVTDVNGYGLLTTGIKGLRRQAAFSMEPWHREPTMADAAEPESARGPTTPVRLVTLPNTRGAGGLKPRSPCPMCPGREDAHVHAPEYLEIIDNLNRETVASPALYVALPSPGSYFEAELLFIYVTARGDPAQGYVFLIPKEHAPLTGRARAMRARYPLAVVADILTAPIQLVYFVFFFRG